MTLHRTNEALIVPPAVEPVSIKEAQDHLRQYGQFDADTIQTMIVVARTLLEEWCWSAFITQTWQYWWDKFWYKMFIPRPPMLVGWQQGALVSAAWANGTATLTFTATGGNQFLATLYVGQSVQVSGVSPAGYNGTATITAITPGSTTTAGTLSYALASDPGAGTDGTVATGYNNGGMQWIRYLMPQALSAAPANYVTLAPSIWETSKENQLPFMRMAYLQTYPVTRGYRDDVTASVVCGYGNNPQDVPAPIRHAIKLMVEHLYVHRGEQDIPVPQAIADLITPFRFREM